MKTKKGEFYTTLLVVSILLLLVWYGIRINAIWQFNKEVFISLQSYAEEEEENSIYVFKVGEDDRMWWCEIPCEELSQSRIEIVKNVFLNFDAVLGVERGTVYLYMNGRCLWLMRLSLLLVLMFGIRVMMISKGGEKNEPLLKNVETTKKKMKVMSKNLAIALAKVSVSIRKLKERIRKK